MKKKWLPCQILITYYLPEDDIITTSPDLADDIFNTDTGEF